MAPAILAQVKLPLYLMDTIFISDLRIETRIGIYAWEKQVPQIVQLDMEIGLRGSHAAHSDRIETPLTTPRW